MPDYWDRYTEKPWYQYNKTPFMGGPGKQNIADTVQPPMPIEPGDNLGGQWVWDDLSGQWVWASEPTAPPQGGGTVTTQPAPTQTYTPPQRKRFGYWDPTGGRPVRGYNPPTQEMIDRIKAMRNQRIGYWDPTGGRPVQYNPPAQVQQSAAPAAPMGYWDPYKR